ncbi:endo alpha-1,4 polygalactosaminidase precursor [Plectosphaerella plurivora]|uniref:alpha-galactosidase n=1 Tax=Plectosphaerella plurivora TaxID=936078 RepID=A0A9P8V2J7_9PEZI|nr:endo alpha-1,4 polygalactosaminidase precursor [Plectosphaerella plurivora]
MSAPAECAPVAVPDETADIEDRASKLWVPAVGTTWQIVINKPLSLDPKNPAITPDVAVYDIDLFDNSAQTIDTLHKMGKKVICYFSAGTWEKWRPDAKSFVAKTDFGKDMDDWPDEKWLNLKSANVRSIMAKRIKMAADKGCDGIDPDNVDGFDNDNGLGLTQKDSVEFIKFLSKEARKYNLSIGLKNAGQIIPQVINDVDFQVNEECVKYKEADVFQAFIKAKKAVFHIEYPKGAGKKVAASYSDSMNKNKGIEGFSTVLKTLDLDGWVQYRDGQTYNTKTSK